MVKRRVSRSVCAGLAILAGSLSFMGSAQTVSLVNEGFEGDTNVFGGGTYTYVQNYTMPNLLVPAGGLKYMNGGPGVNGQVSTNVFPFSASLVGGGISGAQIDSGSVRYNLYSQFSTYRVQGDYASLRVQFLDAGTNPIGVQLSLGGAAFTSALGSGNNGSYPDARDWGADSLSGIVPAGARSARITIEATKAAVGAAIDGYVDNVSVSLSIIPEPHIPALVGLGSGLLAVVRRRRR